MSTLAIPKIEETAKEQELAKEINALTVLPFQSVETEENYVNGVEFLKQLKAKETAVHVLWDEDIETANKLHKSLTGKRRKFLEAIKAAYDRVDFMLDVFRKKKEQERLEQERRDQEAAQREQQDNLLAEAAMLEKSGDILGAESVLAEAQNTPAPVVVAPSLVPKVSGSYTREMWRYRIVSPDKLPREFLIPDEQAIGAVVRSKKKLAEKIIAGIEVWDESKTITKK